MAFEIKYLNPVGGMSKRGTGSAVYTYSNYASDTVTDASFFNSAYDKFSAGDLIAVTSFTSASVPSGAVWYVVTASSSTAVSITTIA